MLRKALSQPAAACVGPRKKSGRSAKAGKAAVAKPSTHAMQDTPLAWLRRRKDKDGQPLITDAQFTAGERLAADYRRAQISRRITSDWSGVDRVAAARRGAPDAGVELSDAAVAARERIKRAIAAVGSELAGILIDVCCHETGLEAAERAEGWPQRAAKVVLQLALTSLARHYGLIAPERSPSRACAIGATRTTGRASMRGGEVRRPRYPISRISLPCALPCLSRESASLMPASGNVRLT